MSSKQLSILDQAHLAAENGLLVVPLVPMGKRPWVKNWTSAATNDHEQIDRWWIERPQSNYGICTGSDQLFVVDLDGSEAIAWWREQGFQPGAEVRTPNGGMHVYYRAPDGYEVQTNAGRIHPKVDIRGVGGQAAGPGSMLPTGIYKGDVVAIANAPEAPIELIELIPEKQSYSQTKWVGEQVKEASEKERQAVAWIVGRLQALPEVWVPGAGWHDAVFQSAAWLSRMVNSGAYAMTPDAALTILLTHTPTYPDWAEDKVIEQWESAVNLTEGQFAEPPRDDDEIPGLLPLVKAQIGVPEYDSKGRQFMDLVWTDAYSDDANARRDRRHQVMLEAFRVGLDMQHAFSLAAGSVAAEVIMREHDGRTRLFKEAKNALRDFEREQAAGFTITEHDAVQGTVSIHDRVVVELLTPVEREGWNQGLYRWWGDQYIEWIHNSLKLANMPYHRLHLWMILANKFGQVAYVPREGKKLGMNLWGVIVGESSSGKTEALDKEEAVIDACFLSDSPNLGADATTEALHDALIGRDGKPSYQVIDEAHGILGELAGPKGFRGDLITRWTEFYEGKVRATLRSTKKEISGKSASTSFSLLLQGTTEKMRRAMSSQLWESGFLVRALFVIGETVEPSEEDLDVRLIEGDPDQAYNKLPRDWAAIWAMHVQGMQAESDEDRLKITFTPGALARLNSGMRRMREQLKTQENQVALKPYAMRFPNQALKLASLVALSQKRTEVSERDVIIALQASEEFLSAAIEMARMTMDSDFGQQVDRIERYIAEQGGRVDPAKVYRHFPEPAREVDGWVDQLVREKRVKKQLEVTGGTSLELIRDTKERKAA